MDISDSVKAEKAERLRQWKRMYMIWWHMKRRCTDIRRRDYKWYGGKGIEVCDEWYYSFDNFKTWALSNGYDEKLTLDRIDVNGNYEPSNCRWATWITQANNKTTSHKITYNGMTHTVSEWGRITGLGKGLINARIHKYGWDEIKAISTPHPQKRQRYITYKGVTKKAHEFAKEYGLKPDVLLTRLKSGWSVEDALTLPVTHKNARHMR